jgi:hypothetical protein
VAYVYEPDRKHARPAQHLAGFRGILQVDGYGAYTDLAEAGDVVLAFCWSHSRRKFYDIQVATPAPIAAEALMRIATLYTIEDDIRGRSAEERKQARQQRSKPLVEALHVWLQDKLKTVSAKSTIAEAIRYSLSRWEGLSRFLDDGRIEIDSNVVERGMRTIALGRKNHLFAGSDYGAEHWAVISSLIETCKMNRVDPQAYLRDVLTKIVARHQQYEATNQIVERVVAGHPKKGLIWHFQGSGKSLLMVFAAQKLRLHPQLGNPTVIIVVDRIDLDTQISATFNAADVPNMVGVATRQELQALLGQDVRERCSSPQSTSLPRQVGG